MRWRNEFCYFEGDHHVLPEIVATVSKQPIASNTPVVNMLTKHAFCKHSAVMDRARPPRNYVRECASMIDNNLISNDKACHNTELKISENVSIITFNTCLHVDRVVAFSIHVVFWILPWSENGYLCTIDTPHHIWKSSDTEESFGNPAQSCGVRTKCHILVEFASQRIYHRVKMSADARL